LDGGIKGVSVTLLSHKKTSFLPGSRNQDEPDRTRIHFVRPTECDAASDLLLRSSTGNRLGARQRPFTGGTAGDLPRKSLHIPPMTDAESAARFKTRQPPDDASLLNPSEIYAAIVSQVPFTHIMKLGSI